MPCTLSSATLKLFRWTQYFQLNRAKTVRAFDLYSGKISTLHFTP
jgi:hypothetical protein